MTWSWGGSRIGNKNPNWNGGKYLDTQGYINIKFPSHPRADNQGYIKEHVLIIETAMGKLISMKARPHHINGIKNDNRNQNLVLCENHGYHHLLHQRQLALKSCGHSSWRKCGLCKSYDKPENLFITNDNHVYHRDCQRQYNHVYHRDRQRQHRRQL